MPHSRIGLYPGRPKASHTDPSIESFGQAVGRYMSLGRSIRALEEKERAEKLTNEEIEHLSRMWVDYRAMREKLEPVRMFVLWCEPGESFKEFKARWTAPSSG
jgi:cob(I)alamin adenosyltransferase